ncbi:MAG: MBL fold metallo-hydrolase [Thiolinea sp.]
MQIKLFGVRGSIACPGLSTVRYGGNTACVFVTEKEQRLIFDAGTGIRALGEELRGETLPLHLFFSHYHWDHIQGFPFFRPAYQEDQQLHLLSDHLPVCPQTILRQMTDPHFPVPGEVLKAAIDVLPIGQRCIEIEDLVIRTVPINHPGGGSAYRVDSEHGSFAYVTDNELFPPYDVETAYEEWVSFLEGVDLLLHDAMYLSDELPMIHGWGHSLIKQALQLAVDAHAKNVILFHHDPSRTDMHLDYITEQSREWMFMQKGFKSKVFMAGEGDCYTLNKGELYYKPAAYS